MTMTHRAPDGEGEICAPAVKTLQAALPPAIEDVNAWASCTGQPKLTIAVSPGGTSPVAEQTDLAVPDPQSLMPLLRQITQDVAPGRRP